MDSHFGFVRTHTHEYVWSISPFDRGENRARNRSRNRRNNVFRVARASRPSLSTCETNDYRVTIRSLAFSNLLGDDITTMCSFNLLFWFVNLKGFFFFSLFGETDIITKRKKGVRWWACQVKKKRRSISSDRGTLIFIAEEERSIDWYESVENEFCRWEEGSSAHYLYHPREKAISWATLSRRISKSNVIIKLSV